MPVDLKAIKERAEAATAGPWEAVHCAVSGPFSPKGRLKEGVICIAERGAEQAARANAAFIAHAREDVPALLELVARMRKYLSDGPAACLPDCARYGEEDATCTCGLEALIDETAP